MLKDIINAVIIKGNRRKNFREVAEEWLIYKKNRVKESTYYNYAYCLEKYIYPKFAKKNIEKIRDYNGYIEELSKELSPKTVRDIVAKLKSIIKYYEDEYNTDLKIKQMSLPKLEKNKVRILANKEKEKLEEYCLNDKTLKSLGIMISLNTGLRIGEVCALKWENIDLEEKMIHVKKTLQRVYLRDENKSKVVIGRPKSECSIRSIPINKKLYEILKQLKKKHRGNEFVLTGSSEEFIEPRNYQYNFKLILKECHIRECKFHALRHTFATNCIEVGMDVKSLSEVLGHSDVNITLNIYVHSSDKAKKKYLEKL